MSNKKRNKKQNKRSQTEELIADAGMAPPIATRQVRAPSPEDELMVLMSEFEEGELEDSDNDSTYSPRSSTMDLDRA